MLSFTQQLHNISQMIKLHRPVAFDSAQRFKSASINQAFQQKDIWEKIQDFVSDHGDFRVKDITNFVRKQVADRIGEDKSVSEREEIVRGLLEGGGVLVYIAVVGVLLGDGCRNLVELVGGFV